MGFEVVPEEEAKQESEEEPTLLLICHEPFYFLENSLCVLKVLVKYILGVTSLFTAKCKSTHLQWSWKHCLTSPSAGNHLPLPIQDMLHGLVNAKSAHPKIDCAFFSEYLCLR